MNLQEHIKKVLREEDFIPLEDLNTVIKDYEDGFDVFIMNGDKKIGEISFVKESIPNLYTIVDATIDNEYKGNRIYPKTIINLFKERPNIIINSVFRSPEAEKAWRDILSNLPSNIGKSVKYYKEEDTTLFQLKLRNLQESIRRILREETYSPAGDEYTPGRYVAHKSPPQWRKNIGLTGLQVSVGECYENHVMGLYGEWYTECQPAIFATDSLNEEDMFDSTYNDDTWLIDTECAGVTWYIDAHFEFNDHNHHIVTFEDISPDCLKLIHKGTGKSW